MKVVIDSVRGDSATPTPAAVMDSAGAPSFHGFVEKTGKPLGLAPATGASAARRSRIIERLRSWTGWV